MNKYLIFIIIGILLFLILNNTEKLNIGGPNINDICTIGSNCNIPVGGTCVGQCACIDDGNGQNRCLVVAGGGNPNEDDILVNFKPNVMSRFLKSCSVVLNLSDEAPPNMSEIKRFDLWKQQPKTKGWDKRWFLVFNDRIDYYMGDQLRGQILYTSITEIKIFVNNGYNILHITTQGRIYKLWAGEYYPTTENFDKLLDFTILVIMNSKNLQIISQNDNKVVIEIPQYWDNRGDLPGGNNPLYFILECVVYRGLQMEYNPELQLQGLQKWYDFTLGRGELLGDNLQSAYNLNDIISGLHANGICINNTITTYENNKNIYMAYIIQSSDYEDFNLPSKDEMYNDDSKPFVYDDGFVSSTLHTFFEPFFEYDKKVLICVTVTHIITEDILQNFQYNMGIYRSIGYTKYKYREQPNTVSNKHDNFHTLSDNGKGSGYGQLSLKLHAFSSLALDLISKSIDNYKKRLIVTHPIDNMARIFTQSNLLENIDFWLEKYDSTFRQIRNPENIYELDYTSQTRIHIPSNLSFNNNEYILNLQNTCIHSADAISSATPTFITKNISLLNLL